MASINAAPGIHPDEAAGTASSRLLRNTRGIIFDFDGTLFDNAFIPFWLIAACPPDILRVLRERLIRKRFAGRDYSSPENYYRAFFAAYGKACRCPPLRMRDWYFNRYMPRMIRVLKRNYKPRPGVVELFRHFDVPQALRVAVYSDYPLLKERLEALGLSPGPGILLYGPESFGAQKPAARPFLRIAGDLGAAPEEVLVIGDRKETDGLGALNAGMRFFFLDPCRQPVKEESRSPSPAMHAGAWDDLVKLLLEN
jgi:FMN phosphatase YigB (HAD superfamily)